MEKAEKKREQKILMASMIKTLSNGKSDIVDQGKRRVTIFMNSNRLKIYKRYQYHPKVYLWNNIRNSATVGNDYVNSVPGKITA